MSGDGIGERRAITAENFIEVSRAFLEAGDFEMVEDTVARNVMDFGVGAIGAEAKAGGFETPGEVGEVEGLSGKVFFQVPDFRQLFF